MRYAPDIFAAYSQVFDDAHEHLKTAGMGDWVRNILNSGANARRVGSLTDDVARQEAALGGSVEAFAKQQYDSKLLQAQLNKARAEASAVGASAAEAAAPGASSHLGRNLALGGAAVGAAGLGGYAAGQRDKTRTRNLAFGAGTATGLALPGVVRGLGSIAQGAQATGAFPELASVMGDYSNAAY